MMLMRESDKNTTWQQRATLCNGGALWDAADGRCLKVVVCFMHVQTNAPDRLDTNKRSGE